MYKMPSLGLMLLEVVSREESFTFTFEVTFLCIVSIVQYKEKVMMLKRNSDKNRIEENYRLGHYQLRPYSAKINSQSLEDAHAGIWFCSQKF